MIDPPPLPPLSPLQYQGPSPSSADTSHLKILSVLHYVWGGMTLVFSSIFILYIVIGILIASGKMNSNFAPTATTAQQNQLPPAAMGYLFIGMGSCTIVFGWSIGIVTILSGRKMAARRSRIFSIVIAGLNCISFPIGTTLGVFTIIVLCRQSVKELYANPLTG